MPHLIIEYAAPLAQELDIQVLVEAAFNAAKATDLFDPAAIKARAHPVDAYWIGGTKQLFVHIEVKLLPGRTAAQKKALSERVFETVAALIPADVAVSVEVNDLDADVYTKRA